MKKRRRSPTPMTIQPVREWVAHGMAERSSPNRSSDPPSPDKRANAKQLAAALEKQRALLATAQTPIRSTPRVGARERQFS